MADQELNDILNGATSGPDLSSASQAPSGAGAGGDELTAILHGPNYIPPLKPSEKALLSGVPEKGPIDTFTSGLARGWGQAQATIPSLKAMYKEYNGDLPGAIESAKEAEAIQKPYGESEWNLQNIHSPGDFGYWVTEKLGEQGVNLATMMATGGAGGLSAKLAATAMLERGLITQGTAKSMLLAGGSIPAYAVTSAMESAGTSQEQFQVTSQQGNPSTKPEMSLAAGMAKGVLELYTPLSISRALMTPGLQLGKSLPGAIGKNALKEGATEAAQEAIDIYARKITDPGYSYFKDGPTLMPSGWGEGMWRLAESSASGAVVGGIYGAPFAHMERNQENRAAVGNEPPGTRTVVQQEQRPVWYHGTNSGFKGSFKESDTGGNFANLDVNVPEDGIWFTDTPDRAHGFAKLAERNNPNPNSGQNIRPVVLDYKNPYTYPAAEFANEGISGAPSISELKTKGHDALIVERGKWEYVDNKLTLIPQGRDVAVFSGAQVQHKPSKASEPLPFSSIGPISSLRQLVLKPASQEKTLRETLNSDPRNDALGINALLGGLKLHEDSRERFADLLEANTPRFIEANGDLSRLMTDTEIELHGALNVPQGVKPQYHRVNQDALQPAAITAHLSDLAEPGSERIYFIPEKKTTPQDKAAALADYAALYEQSQREATGALISKDLHNLRGDEWAKKRYDQILTQGLRVIPSRGTGFYYNGMIDYKGLPIEDIKATRRSDQVALLDITTKELRFPQPGEDFQHKDSEVIVSLDLNRLKEGVDFKRLDGGNMQLTQIPDLSKWTPGIRRVADSQPEEMQLRFSQFLDQPNSIVVLDPGSNTTAGRQFQREVEKILPAIDGIFKRIGIDGKIFVGISEAFADQGPIVFADQGVIMLPPSWLSRFPHTQNVTLLTHDWLMHEVGHMVTFHFWKNFPVEIQDGVIYAWEQARLQERMGSTTKIGIPGSVDTGNISHWTTLSEFLAEQFRRWGTSSATAQTELEKTWKDGGRKLESFYKEWEKRLGTDAVMDLTHPHHYFSAAMDYLKGYREEKDHVKQVIKRNTLLQVPQDVLDSPVLTGIANQVISAIESMNPMLPRDLKIHLKSRLDPGIFSDELISTAPAASTLDKQTNLDFIEMALFALGEDKNPGQSGRMYLAHELMHSYERRGLFTPEELRLLTKEARQNQTKLLPPNAVRAITEAYRAQGKEQNIPSHLIDGWIQESIEAELRAYYVMQFANTGIAFGEGSKTILARLMAVIEKIRNYLNNMGYQTKDDLLRAFFKGEMVHRADRGAQQAQSLEWINSVRQQLAIQSGGVIGTTIREDASWQKDGMTVKAFYDGEGAKKEANAVIYHWFSGGQLAGELILENKGPKGFSIEWVETANAGGLLKVSLSQGSSLQRIMLQEAERDLGVKFKMPGYFTQGGFQMARLGAKIGQVDKGMLSLYTPVKMQSGNTAYVSPHYLKKQVQFWGQEVAKIADEKQKITDSTGRILPYHDYAVEQFKNYRALVRQLPKNIWEDPRLDQMFSLKRNFERDEVQGSLLRSGQQAEENQLKKTMGLPSGETQDAFSKNFELKQKISQGENARVSGLPFELSAPSTMYSFNLKKIWEWQTGMGNAPRVDKELVNLRHEVDRIGKFTKFFITLRQLARSNEHIIPLQQLIQNEELAGLISNKWLRQAGETVHAWDSGLRPERREAIANTFFALTEGKYRTPAEIAAGTERNPGGKDEWGNFLKGIPPIPNGELSKLFKDNKLLAKDWEVIRRVSNDFLGFLQESEMQLAKRLTKKFGASPQMLTQALAKLQLDMAKLKNKPYFPMVRFGEFTIAVREAGKVVWASAYGTQRERDAAVKDVRGKYPSGNISVGRIPLHAVEFAGLPGPLLQELKESILDENGKTPDQVTLIRDQKQWIEEFEMLNDPDKTFRKRWLPSKGLPGYSMDAMRVYSHYFQSGSRYLARLAYMDEMRANVNALQGRAMSGGMGNYAKPKAIADYASNWLNYYLEGGRDAGKLRAFAALWYLGFSPAAAFMNLTQPLMVTVPKMGADFNVAKSYAEYIKAASFIGKNQYEKGGLDYLKAREEMVRQNYIDVGQGAELAALSEGNNLSKLKAGTKLQAWWRKLNYTGMYMFGAAEHYNREVTIRAAWQLAMDNPGAERLQKLDVLKTLEIADLTSRLGMSQKEAVAFLYAKETISDTQFIYSKSSDAPFMRNAAKDFLIFFKYTQNMLWAFGKNGAMIHMLILFAFFYGLKGLPGSEDLNEVLRLISRKLFGYDFDLHGSAREFARGVTKGSIFDETGPDLLLHGVSRYGFGLGLLPNGWATPRFDASANGSMGKIIPGFAEVMHGVNTQKPTNDLIADAAGKAAGAGYGPIFVLLHAMNDPGSSDSKKWANVLLPRFLKAEYKAYRYGIDPQAETTNQGAKIVKFDPTDPMDLATIAGQAFGFQPTKVSQTWEALREIQDIKAIYKARRSMIYVQFDKALMEDNKAAIEDVRKAINEYNKEVVDVDPQFVIKGNQLQSSLKQRIQQREMMEATLSKTKGDIGLTRRVMDLFPGVKAERVK